MEINLDGRIRSTPPFKGLFSWLQVGVEKGHGAKLTIAGQGNEVQSHRAQ